MRKHAFAISISSTKNLLIKVGISKNLVRMSKDRLGMIKDNGENEKRFLALE